MKRKSISLLLACSMVLGFMPQAGVVARAAADESVVFSNDFESSKLPDEVAGILTDDDISIAKLGDSNKALKVTAKFDGTDDWDNNKHELEFKTKGIKDIAKGSKVEYDLLVPTANKNFKGQMKSAGGFSTYDSSADEWGWASLECGNITSANFEDLGNGYSKVHVSSTLGEDVKGVNKLDIQIDAYKCNYEGSFYLDNIKISAPDQTEETKPAEEAKPTVDKNIYYSDFEANQLPTRVDGVLSKSNVSIAEANDSNALKIKTKFDGGTDWDSNKHEMIFDVKSDDEISTDAELEFDLLIPTKNKDYSGLMQIGGGFSTLDGTEWGWVNNSGLNIKSAAFTDLGNGYSSTHVVVNPSDVVKGLQNINIQLVGYSCTYKGDVYIDNLRLHEAKGEKPDTPQTGLLWDFNDASKKLDGWKFDSTYAYDGAYDVSYDKDFTGSGSMKVDVAYSPKDSWSEVKVDKWINAGINLGDYNTIKFNLYYNPANMTQGTFKSQFWATEDVNKSVDIDLSKSEYLGKGLSKVPVTITYTPKDVKTNILILSIVGSSTDYTGSVYMDDINLTKLDVKDPYVEKTAVPTDTPTKVDISNLETPSSVKLADADATDSTASLFAYLKGVGKSKKAIFGHQDPTTYKAGPKDSGNDSDVEDLTGSLPGVCGIDGLCFTGAELQLKPGDKRDLVTATADVTKAEAEKGAILSLSAHMPNFAGVAEKGKKNGKWDYSGYTVNDLHGNTAQRILPGGDLNEVFTGYLDMIADYAHQMDEADVPILFRPFHECTGNWFWWGTAACDNDTYKSLFAYTVEYLRDTKNVHNFLYVYSPSGGFADTDEYMSRYPGDAFVDVMAMDQYHNNPKGGPDEDGWFQNLKDCVTALDGLAKEHDKIPALSETGVATYKGSLYEEDGAMAVSGNHDKDWFKHVGEIVADSDMPYYMVWANFAKDNFYVPYMVNDTKGHEMVDNFINYYNQDDSVFANGIGDYKSVKAAKEGAYDYAYIESPASGSRILKPATIKAKVNSKSTDIKYEVKAGDELIATLAAKLNKESGLYEAEIDQDLLDKIGGKVGTIALTADDKVMASAKYIFNIAEPEVKNDVVDDFESYGDEDSLLQGVWTTNHGPGCTVTPTLVKDEDGNHKMKFNYNINTSQADEGYAGVLNAKSCDWSEYDALQLYIKPDGNGQKLVVQITCNGEDFEVHLPEFAATTEGKTLTIPFSDFKGKKNGTFDPANITSFGLWCNTIVPKDHEGVWTVDSSFEYDNMKAVKMSDVEEENKNKEAVKEAAAAVEKAEASKTKTDVEAAKKLVEALTASNEKTALVERLDAIKVVEAVDPAKEAIKKATEAVTKAETSKAAADIKAAQELVNALEKGSTKTSLQTRLDKLNESLKPVNKDAVKIEDANLKKAILSALQMAPTAELTKADMLKLKTFEAKNANIKSLAGLEYATNLKWLDITKNNVSDISAIKGLKNLKYLTLLGNPIDDEAASVVTDMTSLLTLNLDNTKITNIEMVSGLVNLRSLYVSNTTVSDLTPVQNLTKLRHLYFCNTKVTDITPLYTCDSLNVIGLAGTGLNYNIYNLGYQMPNLTAVLSSYEN